MLKLVVGILVWVMIAVGCGGPKVIEPLPPKVRKVTKPETQKISEADSLRLEMALNRRVVSLEEVIDLSNRLLRVDHPATQDGDTLTKLEILLLRGLKQQSKSYRPLVLRNLGIVNYHQKQYKKARQALQASSELSPRDARTHFFLACIYARQAKLLSAKGRRQKSKAQYKRAQIEMEQVRKLAPSNRAYQRNLQEVMELD